MGPIEAKIHDKLTQAFQPGHLELENESSKHSVPKGSETHFRLVLVSERFVGLSRVARSRLIHECLDRELKGGVHALALRTLTPDEWRERGETIDAPSPDCKGGSRRKG